MAKFKGFNGVKYCSSGERYIFKNGKAIVPGMHREVLNIYPRIGNNPPVHITRSEKIRITLKEFNEWR